MYRKIVFVLLFMPLWAWGAVSTAVNDTTPEALYRLGQYYLTGNDSLGIYMNEETGVELIRQAAERGNAPAQFRLALCYEEGQGLSQDYGQAIYWWRKAAEQGDAEAQYSLGICYAEGIGVDRDSKQAEYWKNLAIQNGYQP